MTFWLRGDWWLSSIFSTVLPRLPARQRRIQRRPDRSSSSAVVAVLRVLRPFLVRPSCEARLCIFFEGATKVPFTSVATANDQPSSSALFLTQNLRLFVQIPTAHRFSGAAFFSNDSFLCMHKRLTAPGVRSRMVFPAEGAAESQPISIFLRALLDQSSSPQLGLAPSIHLDRRRLLVGP